MVLKGFFRKKTTRIYLVIFVVMLFVLGFIGINLYNTYQDCNENYKDSVFMVEAKRTDIDKLYSISNIRNVYYSLYAYFENYDVSQNEMMDEYVKQYVSLYANSSLSNNEIILSFWYDDDYSIGDMIVMDCNGISVNFVIKDFLEEDGTIHTEKFYISEEVFNSLSVNYDTVLIHYQVNNYYILSYFTEKEVLETIDYTLEPTNQYDDYDYVKEEEISTAKYPEYFYTIIILAVVGSVASVIFIIVTIITIHNVVVDEAKSNYLYHCLGYNKGQIRVNNIKKVVVLLLIALLISVVLLIPIGVL